jgi:signal transduction histidine kinase
MSPSPTRDSRLGLLSGDLGGEAPVGLNIRRLIMVMIVVFVLAPMLLTDWLLTKRAGEALMDNIKRDVEDTAGEVADGVGDYLQRGELIVARLADSPAFRSGATDRVEQLLDSIIRSFPFTVHACYVRGDEAILCQPGGVVRVAAAETQDTPWYALATTQGGLGWTRAYKSSAGRPVVAVAAPVRAQDGQGGVVALEYDLRAISDLLRRYRLGRRGTIFILDEGDRLVAHRRSEWLLQSAATVMTSIAPEDLQSRSAAITPEPERRQGVGTDQQQRADRSRRAGSAQRADRPQRADTPQRPRPPAPGARVLAWAPIDGPGWSVGVVIPLAEYSDVLRGLLILGLSIAALAFACAIAFGIVLCRMIVCPIGELAEGTRRIAEGDFDHRVNVPQRNELGELGDAFNSMAGQLDKHRKQERLSLIGRMASGVIHDLRTPMAIVRTSLPVLLRSDASDAEKQQIAGIVNGAIDRMAGMTQDVLEYARSETAGPELETMDVGEFVSTVEESLRHDFELSGIALQTKVDGAIKMRADREKLARAFYNIAENAQDAMGAEGTFSICASSFDHRVRFVLADTGPGIPPEIASQLFEPFVTSGKRHGTGLGLAIAREIVDAHGGQISAESQPGEGARFVIDIPRTEA